MELVLKATILKGNASVQDSLTELLISNSSATKAATASSRLHLASLQIRQLKVRLDWSRVEIKSHTSQVSSTVMVRSKITFRTILRKF